MADTTTEKQSDSPAPLNVEKTRTSKFRNAIVGLSFLVVILGFALWLRLPMIVHAERHLDSDLAVDGLVLRQYLRTGKLDGAYPGTPHIATLPVFLSLPAVRIWGDSPASLVFAGTAAAVLTIIPVCILAWRAYGAVPALLAGLVLAAGGLGQVWLSARVTGGHLLAAAWLAWIWLAWSGLIGRRSTVGWYFFGMICAIAFYSDRIFLLGLAGVGIATVAAIRPYRVDVPVSRRMGQAWVFIVSLAMHAFVCNDHAISGQVSAYGDQFAMTTDRAAIVEHIRLLVFECLPRLVLGRIVPSGSTGVTFTHPGTISNESIKAASPVVWIGLGLFVSVIGLRTISKQARNVLQIDAAPAQTVWLFSMRIGLWATTLLTFLAFVLNRNIYNSDNYRYLVLLLPGLGMAVARMTAAGPWQAWRRGLVLAFAASLTFDTIAWQSSVGFRSGLMPARRSESKTSAASADLVDVLKSNPQVVTADFEADYWEVYRALYLADLPIDRGQPFGFFPNRFFPVEAFPNQRRTPRFVVITKSPTSMQILAQIRREGARRVFSAPNLEIYERPSPAAPASQPDMKPGPTP